MLIIKKEKPKYIYIHNEMGTEIIPIHETNSYINQNSHNSKSSMHNKIELLINKNINK